MAWEGVGRQGKKHSLDLGLVYKRWVTYRSIVSRTPSFYPIRPKTLRNHTTRMQVDSEAFHSEHHPTRNNNPERIRM
jgi:hypothetical protein